jgi:hypothetical protein
MTNLDQYIQDKNQLSGVAMIRLSHDNGYCDYTRWKLTDRHILLFDNAMKIDYILWLDEKVSIIDDNKSEITITGNNEYKMIIELFYGGAILWML